MLWRNGWNPLPRGARGYDDHLRKAEIALIADPLIIAAPDSVRTPPQLLQRWIGIGRARVLALVPAELGLRSSPGGGRKPPTTSGGPSPPQVPPLVAPPMWAPALALLSIPSSYRTSASTLRRPTATAAPFLCGAAASSRLSACSPLACGDSGDPAVLGPCLRSTVWPETSTPSSRGQTHLLRTPPTDDVVVV